MGFIFSLITRLVKLVVKLSLFLAVFVAVVVLIPNLPPYTSFTSIQLAPIRPSVGPLVPNPVLNNAEQIFKGKLLGPESLQIHNGEIYTGLATGEVVKVSPGGHVTFVTKVGQPCSGLSQEHICGRPLGLAIDEQGKYIYVVDSYHGIWKVDLKTDKKQLLVSPRAEIEKKQPMLPNSIALSKNGDFYWTDSSADLQLRDGAITGCLDPSGRLFYYNAAKNESKVLLDNLWFANGLALSPNNDFVVVAETFAYRLLKYYLTGPKKGQSEVFVDGIPGTPDNVRLLPDGSGVLVGLYMVADEELPIITRSLAPTPIIRKFLARLQLLIQLPFEYLNTIYPHVILEDIVYFIGHFKSISSLIPPKTGLLQVDWNGNIVASYHNIDKSAAHISEGVVYNGKLYLGSPHADYMAVVPAPPLLNKAYESSLKAQPSKPVEQPAKAKVEQPPKPKVEQPPKPKIEQKPQAQPKVETKPKVVEKPKVEQKPKVENKPKVEEKKEAPKVVKPVESKPTQQAKPVEAPKPTPQPQVTTPPPPKPTPAKSAPTAKPEPAKKAVPTTQSAPKPTTAKPEVKTTPPPKPTTPPPKPTAEVPKETKPKKADKPVKQEAPKVAGAKPIKEEIPSDTAKPNKETMKVIKKGGPTEIPVPKQ